MSNQEFNETRTSLANAFAAAGAELLNYMGASATQAAIPDTQPQKYAIAGTLPGILQMAGQMMGEGGNTGLEGLTRYSEYVLENEGGIEKSAKGDYVKLADVERLLAARAAAEKPTDDLTYEQIMENYRELGGETWGQSQQAVADAFRNHVGAIATDDAAGPYVKFRFRSMADADAALESIIASFSLPASQEGAHAAQWISVDDSRKPEVGKPVLMFVRTLTRGEDDEGRPYETEGAEVAMGEYRKSHGYDVHYFDCYTSPMSDNDWITHWMPLPPAPKTSACAERSGE